MGAGACGGCGRDRSTAGRAARFSGKDLVLFTRQLATLVETAPLEEALRTIGTQSERRGVRRVTSQTHALVVEGFRLSDAMARQGKAFPALYRAMVAAGESAGALPQVLERLAICSNARRRCAANCSLHWCIRRRWQRRPVRW